MDAFIRGLTDQVSMLRWRLSMERAMKMDRLSEKLAKAAGVAARQNAKIEARADALIAREDEIEKHTEKVFVQHEAVLDGQDKGLDKLEASLRLLSNGAPLGASTASPVGLQPGHVSADPAVLRPDGTITAPEARPANWNFDR